MSEERREEHLPDAIAHAVVPPAQEAAPPPESEQPSPEAADRPPLADSPELEEGPMIRQAEELFPVAWLAMLTVISVVGIYNAVSRLPQF